jgi:FkbM family methyltransferase
MNRSLRKLLWSFGYDLAKFTPTAHPLARKRQMLEAYEIDTVLDVGANAGQFARQLRRDLGYRQRILSFEPLSGAFARLRTHAQGDPAWQVFNFALGDVEERREINVAANSQSSSLLGMLPRHESAAPEARVIGREAIEIRTLDSLFGELCREARHVYLKIDTQGYESKVLKGAEKSLAGIGTVQLEMSLVPLYDGELLLNEMCALLSGKGYTLVALDNGFSDPASGQLLQVDGVFRRL